MSISYPLSLPTTRGIAGITLSDNSVVAVSESPFTFSQQVQVFPGQRWTADIALPAMKRADAEPWIAFLLALKGRQGTFLLGDPLGTSPRGVGGSPTVNGAGQTGNQLVVGGWTPSTSGVLKAGDYIQLIVGGNYRLHKVLTDTNSDSSGNTALDIWPNLRESPTTGQAVILANTVGQFRRVTNVQPWTISAGGIYTLSFSAVEAL